MHQIEQTLKHSLNAELVEQFLSAHQDMFLSLGTLEAGKVHKNLQKEAFTKYPNSISFKLNSHIHNTILKLTEVFSYIFSLLFILIYPLKWVQGLYHRLLGFLGTNFFFGGFHAIYLSCHSMDQGMHLDVFLYLDLFPPSFLSTYFCSNSDASYVW